MLLLSSLRLDMIAASTPEIAPPRPDSPEHDSPADVPADRAVRRKRRWGCAILILLALATPVIFIVGAYVAIVWSSDRMAEEAIAKARAAGDPVDAAAMTAYYPTTPAIEKATAHWARAMEIVGAPAFNASTIGIPLFDGTRVVADDEILRPGDLAKVKAFLDQHRAAIDEAHAARRAGSVARFPTDFEQGMTMLLPHVQNLRGVNRLLQLDLEVKLAEGDIDGAVEDLLSMVATSESLANEPILVSQLVRIACLGVAVDGLERTLARHELTEEQLARIQEAFARQRFDDGLRRAYRGEQYMLIQAMRSDASPEEFGVEAPPMLPWKGHDLAKGLEVWRPVIDAGEEGMLEALDASQAMEKEIEAIGDSPIQRLQYPLTTMLLPAVSASAKAFLRGEATARLAETAIACERYRLANGELPAKLDDLVPQFLPAVPADPYDRQPLRYVVTESGASLYSVGADQADDGGLDDPVDGDLPFQLKAEKAPAEKSQAEKAGEEMSTAEEAP